ncbi:uncharacterized protein LOC117179855 [Belonocnema kinseyi]|uniref:uncharacterized protein LOC117179855 n=1 Tax=Belonocnema kinseyi TaxID=2817044 RepID=UPI00143CFF6B|nr:uncharacterized protein LOC117179855 [Belonocnema kinseyi]XP_033227898.1 uncharacterized protein LOC117179855 [Belonocnema kinseyi]XP_033227899.1 uncharacterized protein LOC117179855 [Belonocnema kinseyi]XP_033227900.1 uncharacterized protein LOC117179855 [Belonocnema kinseyi]XP_033227901.1 uncharacterized protein LOC117179855 [Belonocnema kinseyi]
MATEVMDEIIVQKSEKLEQIQLATLLLKNQHSFTYKDNIQENLIRAKTDVSLMAEGIRSLRKNLEELKAENERCKEMASLLEKLNSKIDHMGKNIPPGIKDYFNVQEKSGPKNGNLNHENEENVSPANFTPSVHSSMRDCKKSLFNEPAEVCPLLAPLTEQEFAKIPKYIIGRQTLDAVNSLASSINQILKAKYTLLSLGKDGARKKGDLDLYLEYKKQQTSVKEGEGKIYFFTAEDYQKHTSSKLDKIKLNMLTALRSCKRLREIRIGKLLYYMVVP